MLVGLGVIAVQGRIPLLLLLLLNHERRQCLPGGRPLLQPATGAAINSVPQVLLIFYGAWIAITAAKQDWMVGHISEIGYLQVKYKFQSGRKFACSKRSSAHACAFSPALVNLVSPET